MGISANVLFVGFNIFQVFGLISESNETPLSKELTGYEVLGESLTDLLVPLQNSACCQWFGKIITKNNRSLLGFRYDLYIYRIIICDLSVTCKDFIRFRLLRPKSVVE